MTASHIGGLERAVAVILLLPSAVLSCVNLVQSVSYVLDRGPGSPRAGGGPPYFELWVFPVTVGTALAGVAFIWLDRRLRSRSSHA